VLVIKLVVVVVVGGGDNVGGFGSILGDFVVVCGVGGRVGGCLGGGSGW